MPEIMNTKQPSAPKLESAVLGAMLIDPECIAEVVNILSAESFFDPRNAAIYATIRTMYDGGQDIDLHTVGMRCRANAACGDDIASWLVSCTLSVASGTHAATHARIIRDRQLQRELISAGVTLVAKASNENEDVGDTLAYLSRVVDSANCASLSGRGSNHVSQSVQQSLCEAERRVISQNSNQPVGVVSGIAPLDDMTGGWRAGQLIVLAARPAMGKTALMLHFAKEAARSGVPVCLYSLEMSEVSLADRLLLCESGVDDGRFRNGKLDKLEWAELERASEAISKLPIYIDDNPVVGMRYIKSHSTVMQKRGCCGMILVDYLQLADTALADRKNRNREQEIAEATRQAKIIAKELNVPFMLLSQLSRKCEERVDKRPLLSDLRESGAIEQDADIVAFIYRPKYYGKNNLNEIGGPDIATDGLGLLTIAKHRDGRTGDILFSHNESMTQISEW